MPSRFGYEEAVICVQKQQQLCELSTMCSDFSSISVLVFNYYF